MSKVGIVVPYRDREKQLKVFVPYLTSYLTREGIDHKIIVVQQNNTKDFNRGALLNVGFLEAERLDCDYVAFHDIDMLPVSADYSYPDRPIQIANTFVGGSENIPYDYFGGVTLFNLKNFRDINGYSNQYWGWGFEDNDLLLRCVEARLPLDVKVFKQDPYRGEAVYFNGNSYVQFKSPFNFTTNHLFYIDFIPDRMNVDIGQAHDEGAIFAIPGLDTEICRESFGTYKFEMFDNYEDCYSVHTQKLPEIHCKAVIFYDSNTKTFRFNLNEEFVGGKTLLEGRYPKIVSKTGYLGVANPEREKYSKYFNGKIIQFVGFSRGVTYEDYLSVVGTGMEHVDPEDATVWYDMDSFDEDTQTWVDRSGHGNDGTCVNCTREKVTAYTKIQIPVAFSREGEFVLQKHETLGTKDGYWKSWSTRKNQVRYNRCLSEGTNKEEDGLDVSRKLFHWQVENIDNLYYLVNVRCK